MKWSEEIRRLLAAPPARSYLGLRDRAILETMYSAGLRVSETVGLNDKDLNLTDSAGRVPAPAEMTPVILRGYVAAMHEAGYAKTSISRRLASLRSFFRFAQREGWVASNPAKPLRNPRPDRKLPHFLTTEEISRLLNAPAANQPLGLRDRAILETTYSAGLRVSEVVGLNDGDLDLEDGLVRVDVLPIPRQQGLDSIRELLRGERQDKN